MRGEMLLLRKRQARNANEASSSSSLSGGQIGPLWRIVMKISFSEKGEREGQSEGDYRLVRQGGWLNFHFPFAYVCMYVFKKRCNVPSCR